MDSEKELMQPAVVDGAIATEGTFFDRAESDLQRYVPEGFRLSRQGVYRMTRAQKAGPRGKDLWICSPLYVKAHVWDHRNQNWGKLIEFPDKDGNLHRCLIPMSELAGNGAEWWARLLSQGLQVAPGRKVREFVIAYILSADPDEHLRCTDRSGWYDDTFVLPDESIRPEQSGPMLYQSATRTKHFSARCGSLLERTQTMRVGGGGNRGDSGDTCTKSPQTGESMGAGYVATRSGDSGGFPAIKLKADHLVASPTGAPEIPEVPLGSTQSRIWLISGALKRPIKKI
jgi:hypothetical protein